MGPVGSGLPWEAAQPAAGDPGGGCGYCVVFPPSLAPWCLCLLSPTAHVGAIRTHTHSGSLTPRLPPNLLMSLLARGHLCPLANSSTQAGAHTHTCGPARLYPPLRVTLTHTILCLKCTLILLMIKKRVSYSNHSKIKCVSGYEEKVHVDLDLGQPSVPPPEGIRSLCRGQALK